MNAENKDARYFRNILLKILKKWQSILQLNEKTLFPSENMAKQTDLHPCSSK